MAQLTYSDEGTTFGGTRPQDAWEKLKDKNIQAIGANCTIGPQLLLPVLRELAGSSKLPLSAMPNAGFPKRVGDRIVYPKSSPEYFALFAREAAEIGTRIIGGCCGTTPEHIHAIAEAVKKLRSAKPRGAATGADSGAGGTVEVFEPAERFRRIAAREPESKLWKKIQAAQFVTSVEIDPPKGVSIDRIVEQVGRVMASPHVDSIDINSGTLARVGMDALVLAGALEAHGYETVPHVTTRDANIIGLQAMLLGAWAVGGVRNVLAITGDPPSLGDHPETSGVYEVDSIGLVKVLSRLNQGTDWAGKSLGGATNFTIGVAVNPVAEDIDEELRRFEAKIEAGAHFAMTQPIFDPEHWQSISETPGRKISRAHHRRLMAAHQLQASVAAEQRSSRNRHPRSHAARNGKSRRRRPRARLCPSPSNARLGPHRPQRKHRRRLLDRPVQTLRRNPGAIQMIRAGLKRNIGSPDSRVLRRHPERSEGSLFLFAGAHVSKKPKPFPLARCGSGTQTNILVHLRNPRQRSPFEHRQRIID